MKFAVVYGLGMAENWALIGFFPAFIAALIWIKGLTAFSPRFIIRMAGCGLAGFMVVILFPLLYKFSDSMHPGFWQLLREILGYDKGVLQHFPRPAVALLCLSSVLPVFILGIRWASYFGDNSPLGIFMARSMFHIVYALFLVACLWVALDSGISARRLGVDSPYAPYFLYFHVHGLTFYYLGALSIGYFTGYFLLVFGPKKTRRGPPPLVHAFNLCVVAGVWLLVIIFPAAQLRKNLPHLRDTKVVARAYENYFGQIEQMLPAQGAVVLSDDAFRMAYLEALLVRHGTRSRHLLLETEGLQKDPAYLPFLEKANPGYHLSGPWTNIPPTAPPVLRDIQLLDHLSLDHPLCYIHPGFGYYFEKFYQEPHGLIYFLKPYPSNTWDSPLPTSALIGENQAFWKKTFDEVLPPLLGILEQPIHPSNPGLWDQFMDRAHLKIDRDWAALPLGAFYAHSLNVWGVELQKAGQLADAGKKFTEAMRLNANNATAHYNKKFNESLIAQQEPRVQVVKDLETLAFGQYGGWPTILKTQGLVDDPTFRNDLVTMLTTSGNYRQAVQELDRIKTLDPNNSLTDLQLAQVYIYIQTYTNGLSQLLPWKGAYTTAIEYADRALKKYPGQPTALFLKSVALIQTKAYEQALAPLNELLAEPKQTNNYAALLNRAIANYKVGNLKGAKPDYETVGAVLPQLFQVNYGLGQIADHDGDKPAAIKNFELYLSNAPPNTEEAQAVSKRLRELKGSP